MCVIIPTCTYGAEQSLSPRIAIFAQNQCAPDDTTTIIQSYLKIPKPSAPASLWKPRRCSIYYWLGFVKSTLHHQWKSVAENLAKLPKVSVRR